VRRQLDLVAAVGCGTNDERLSLRIGVKARGRVERLLNTLAIDRDRPWCVLHPGATAASRRYPAERFAAVVRSLVSDHSWQVILTGADDERALVQGILQEAAVPCHALAGSLTLEELAALIALAPVLISNNTGPVHVAAAVGTPVVDLYALTNPQHTPWLVPIRVLYHDVPCKFCYKSVCPERHHDCLSRVAPEAVVSAARQLHAESRPARAPSVEAATVWERAIVHRSLMVAAPLSASGDNA
jgi:lipopolysaccharide heptosyltransferase II